MEEELAMPININQWALLERYQLEQCKCVKVRESHYIELCAQLRRKPGMEVDQRVNE
jgi:hypothetical protein